MKVFEGELSSHPSKINFLDDSGVFVGYSNEQQCCEQAGWYIQDEIVKTKTNPSKQLYNENTLEDYFFVKSFFNDFSYMDNPDEFCSVAVFKLLSEDKKDLYLHIYNIQNGCYSRGFSFFNKEELIRNGSL